jgi:predicted dehydrogenase
MYSPYLKQFEPLKEECQHFLDCINSRSKPLSCGQEGLKVVQILSAASESLKQNGAAVSIGDLG